MALVSLLLPSPGAQAAEPQSARLSGEVRDASGAVIPAASVELKATGAIASQASTTDAAGRYAFGPLAPGRYVVTAAAQGFGPVAREVLVLGATSATLVLPIERANVLVEVTARSAGRPLAIETDPRAPRQPIPAHDGADYLKTIPGFSVIRKGGADGDPVLRGMAGSRLGVLLDGENVLGGCGNRMDPPTAYAFPEAYDRITVLKGPQTVAYGPGNSAGVVLFERTREAVPVPGVKYYLSPTFGAFGRNDQAADLSATGRRIYARASATRSAMDDYRDGAGHRIHSQYERWSANALAGWTPDAKTRVEVSGAKSDGEAAYADRAMDGVKFARENVGLRLERRDVSRVVRNAEAQLFYNYVDHVMDNYSLRTFTPSMTMPGRSVSNPDRRTMGGRAAADLQIALRLQARVGLDWQANRHSVRSTSNQSTTPYEDAGRTRDARFDDLGVFTEATAFAASSSRVVTGLRVDRWNAHDDRKGIVVGMGGTPQPNPTAGLARKEWLVGGFGRYEHDLAPDTTLYAGVGRAERSPDFWELVSKESLSSLSAFETRPEKTTQLDAGVLFRHSGVSGSLAVFASTISDFILVQSNYAKAVKPAGTGMGMGGMTTTTRKATVSRNVDASTWGAEASAAWDVRNGVRLDASLAWVRGQNETDARPLAQLPPLEGRLGLAYASERWSAGSLARLVAAQRRYALDQGNIVGQDLGPTSRFAVFSVNGGYRVAKGAQISVGVDNLFDTTYAEFVSRGGAMVPGFTQTRRINEPGRTAWIKLDLRR
jgi:iron complex outermembrane receptor protein